MKPYLLIAFFVILIQFGCEKDDENINTICNINYHEQHVDGSFEFSQKIGYSEFGVSFIENSDLGDYTFEYDVSGNLKKSSHDEYDYFNDYNDYGLLLQTEIYKNDQLTSTLKYEYIDDFLIKSSTFNSKGYRTDSIIYKYGDDAKIYKEIYVDKVIEYFYLTNKDSIIALNSNGELDGYKIIKYKERRQISEEWFNVNYSNTILQEKETWEYVNDLLVRKTLYANIEELNMIIENDYRIDYNEYSMINKIENWFSAGEMQNISFFNYDSKLNLSKIETYDKNGELLFFGNVNIQGSCSQIDYSDLENLFYHLGNNFGLTYVSSDIQLPPTKNIRNAGRCDIF